jgi:hypothetical protein
MDYRFLYHSYKYIIFNPVKAWTIIHDENRPIKDIRNIYFFPLIIIVALSAFLGSLIFKNVSLSPVYSILIGIKYLILYFLVVLCSAVILNEIIKALDLGKSFVLSFKMITCSMIPLLITQVVSQLFESLIFVNILALYGLYIFWIGLEKMLNPPEHKKMPMLVAIFIVVVELFIATNWVLNLFVNKLYFSVFA